MTGFYMMGILDDKRLKGNLLGRVYVRHAWETPEQVENWSFIFLTA